MKSTELTSTARLLRELVAIPSVNPGFLPAGDPTAGESQVAEKLAGIAHQAGIDVEWQPVFEGRSNLLIRLTPSGSVRNRILLAPHLDTVGAQESAFTPQIRNGRLYGRGACDTKGSVAAMLTALLRLANQKHRPKETEIAFAGLVDEENTQFGSRTLIRSGMRANLAIVGEPTRLNVVTAHKGNIWLELETRGRAAHGARPELGRNAVSEMARLVTLLETDYTAMLRQRTHPLLGRPTVNVGTIQGGQQANVVPDWCRIQVDRRYLPGETEKSIRNELKELVAWHGFSPRYRSLKPAPCWPLETDENHPQVQQFRSAVRSKQLTGVDFFCDAGILNHGGIPSLVYGPGDIAQAHTATEWISLKALDQATDRIGRFLASLL